MTGRDVARAGRRWVPAGLLLAALACASSAPTDRFYRLPPEAGSPSAFSAPILDGSLGVERLRADGLVRERAVVYSDAPGSGEVQRYNYHHWVEPTTDMIQERLVAYLQARRVARLVVTPEMRVRPDFVVTGRLLRFEQILGAEPGVAVEMRLSLKRAAGGELLASGTYRAWMITDGTRVKTAVAAFGAALDQVFAGFVADLARQR